MRHGASSNKNCRSIILSSKQIRDAVESGRDSLRVAGIVPSLPLLDSIAAYIELLLRWNRKLNLTSITEPREIMSRNFAESFLAARWFSSREGRLCDVGSGAGFPGLALRLVLPHWKLILVEQSSKKSAFLAEAVRILNLQDVRIERKGWQDTNIPEVYLDAITSRALGGHQEMANWASKRLTGRGRLILWLGARDADRMATISGWSWERLPVPGSRERVILAGSVVARLE